MRYTEETLQSWTSPLSPTEEKRVENTVIMIKNAIKSCKELDNCEIEIFAQGSYANNTNVRNNSDVDICVMLKSTFYMEFPDGLTREDYGFLPGSISFEDYRKYVLQALIDKFGRESVDVGNKSIKISSNSYHVQADVVPAFMLKDFSLINSRSPQRYIEGIRFYSKGNKIVTNYPKDHIANSKNKNVQTNHAYKKLVRIMKRIRNNMVDEGIIDKDIISSFLVECLVWNVPNSYITDYSTWNETLQRTIAYLYTKINKGEHSDWGEVSEHLYLFINRKWTDNDVKQFLLEAWGYLEF